MLKTASFSGAHLDCAYKRIDVQRSVRLLSVTYMANPTKTAMAAIKKLTSYLRATQDMVLRFEKNEGQSSVFCRRKHLTVDQAQKRGRSQEHQFRVDLPQWELCALPFRGANLHSLKVHGSGGAGRNRPTC